ncbi:MAG TPA: dipeptidase [Chloroflexota bacterium]
MGVDIERYVEQERARFLDELAAFLAIPSVSSSSAHRADVERCARFIADHLRGIGFQRVDVLPTGGHPVVYAEWLGRPGKPTALIYGHYDVQPTDPEHLWESPPFQASVRDGAIFARGAADDKGQVFMHWKALEAYFRLHDGPPVNIKLLIEGEEEVGSAHLDAFVETHRDLLSADVAVVSDTSMFRQGLPSIVYGLRGIAYFEVEVVGPKRDLHSGVYGGAVANPIQVLCELIARVKDEKGRVAIPGFYDDVRPLTAQERAEFARLPFDEEAYRRDLGVVQLAGEEGYTTLERVWARPSFDPNGIWGGFTGEGSKTVLPSRAAAKVSFRLVPDQDPNRVADLFETYLHRLCPPSVSLSIKRMHVGKPVLTPLDHPAVQAASRALERGFQRRPVFIREGGSIPVVATLQDVLKLPTLLVGVASPDAHIHAPNERLELENLWGGIRSVYYLWQELAALPRA